MTTDDMSTTQKLVFEMIRDDIKDLGRKADEHHTTQQTEINEIKTSIVRIETETIGHRAHCDKRFGEIETVIATQPALRNSPWTAKRLTQVGSSVGIFIAAVWGGIHVYKSPNAPSPHAVPTVIHENMTTNAPTTGGQ